MAGRRSPVSDIREILRQLRMAEPARRIARDAARLGRRGTGARPRAGQSEVREQLPDHAGIV